MSDTPQQPNRPEGLREILFDLAMNDFIAPSRAEPRIAEALAAIRTRIERAIPEKRSKPDDDASRWAEGVYRGHCQAIEEFKSNIQRELGI